MFHVFLSGQIKNKKQLEQFCYDVMYHFFDHVDHDVDIDIRVLKDIGGQMGFCWGDSDYIVIELAKGNFIDGEYMPFEYNEIVTTLAHELVHAKQHVEKSPAKDTEKEAYDLEYTLVERFWHT